MRPHIYVAAVALLVIGWTGCSPEPEPEDQRLLILPIENQSSDAALDWMASLSSAVLEYDLSGVHHLVTTRVPWQADHALQGYFVQTQDRLTIHLSLLDSIHGRTIRLIETSGPASAGIVPLLDSIAKGIRPEARSFPARNASAVRALGDALWLNDPVARVKSLESATTLDPQFTPGFFALAEVRQAAGDKNGVLETAAAARRTASDPLDKALLDDLIARLKGDLSGRETALRALTTWQPAQLDNLRALAEVHTTQRKFRDAVQDYGQVERAEPNDPNTYNSLGYLHAYLHDRKAATDSLNIYKEMLPNEVNPLDSLGEVHYMLGDFAAAESQFRLGYEKNPRDPTGAEMFKAAQSHFMAGDPSGAEKLLKLAFDANVGAPPDAMELMRARWEFLTGRRKQGMARLDKLRVAGSPDLGALAGAQLSVWQLQTGDRTTAIKVAAEAYARAASDGVRSLTALARFIADPTPDTPPIPLAGGIADVLAGRFAEAIQKLEPIYRQTSPAEDSEVRSLLAFAYVKAGRVADAKSLVDLYPLPPSATDSLFSSLTLPSFLWARAGVMQAEQRTEEARRTEQLSAQIEGDLPDRI